MGVCYKKTYYNYLRVIPRNIVKILQILDHFSSLGLITKEQLQKLHDEGRYPGIYKYGYYDRRTHQLVYGTLDHEEYEDDGWGFTKYPVQGWENRHKSGEVFVYGKHAVLKDCISKFFLTEDKFNEEFVLDNPNKRDKGI